MKYDQHFLRDFEIAKQMVSFLEIKKNEKVLEIRKIISFLNKQNFYGIIFNFINALGL